MAGRLRALWQNLLAGFWFIPGAVAAVLAASSFVFIEIDRAAGPRGAEVGFDGDAGAARDILSTIAGSLITVAGITFSLTIVVLTLVSSQFTPRALRGFLGDRVNQVVAGAFVGIFLYCLLVLRSVRGSGERDALFVPALSVTVAIALGLLTLVLLLLFIHHMGQSIQASHIAARVSRQTLAAIDRLHPQPYAGVEADEYETVRSSSTGGEPATVTASRPGYVQLVDLDAVVENAPSGARLHVAVRPGDFVTEHDALVRIWPPDSPSDAARAALRQAIPVENERDLHQDASYGLRQLSDIALKALSPGINDPTTAVTCVGYLRAALERLARREIPAAGRRADGAVVVADRRTFDEYANSAFSEIGRYASENARVVLALLAALQSIARAARSAGAPERLTVLGELGEAIATPAIEAAAAQRDEQLLRRELERLRETYVSLRDSGRR